MYLSYMSFCETNEVLAIIKATDRYIKEYELKYELQPPIEDKK